MATWPVALPTAPIADGYQEIMPDNVIRSQMDTGYPKVRKRSTAAPYRLRLQYNMTASQVTTLVTFFETTLEYGVDTFTMNHPRTGSSETFRILSPPEISIADGVNYRVQINMEQLP